MYRKTGRLPHTRPQVISVSSNNSRGQSKNRSHRSGASVNNRRGIHPRPKTNGTPESSSGSSTSFIDAMNQRALARKQKRDARRARYEQAEKERRCLAAWREQMSGCIAPEAARAGRLYLRRREAQENRRLKKQRAAQLEKRRQAWAKAVLHDVKQCMHLRGLKPWKAWLMARKKRSLEATAMAKINVIKHAWGRWASLIVARKRHARIVEMRKTREAERVYRTRLLMFGWRILFEPHRQMLVKEKAVSAQHAWNTLGRFWRAWNREVAATRSQNERRYAFAREHFSATLKVKMLAAWQDGVKVLKEERRTDLRRRQLRSKVDMWLSEDQESRVHRGAPARQPMPAGLGHGGATTVGVEPRVTTAWRRERNPYKY